MLDMDQARSAIGCTAYSSDGDKIGQVGQVFLDDETNQPEFFTVNTGLFGMSESFVPASTAEMSGDRVTLPYTKDQVKDAPNVDAENGHLSQAEERRVYEHYGLAYSEHHSDSGLPTGDVGTAGYARQGAVGHDTSGPTTDDAMTRSEEQVNVGTREQEAGRVRLRKYVETENVSQTVPVRRERAVLETEPITEGNVDDALAGPAISDEEHEVVLNEERPVVEKKVTPVERVRLGKAADATEEQVSEEVRKEQIEVEGDVDDRRV